MTENNKFSWPEERYGAPSLNSRGEVRLGNFIPGFSGEPERYNIYRRIKDFFFRARRTNFKEEMISYDAAVMANDVFFNPATNKYVQPVRLIKENVWRCISWVTRPSRWDVFAMWLRTKFNFIDRYYTNKEDAD